MKILISGVNGFLGRHVRDFFKNKNIVKGIVRTVDESESQDLYSSENVSDIDFKPDVIIMCHAVVSSGNENALNHQLYDSNVALTKKICDKFTDSKFIYLSTVSIYGDSQVIKENSNIYPNSEYAISKLWGESIIKTKEHAIVLRLSSMYGDGMKENTIIPNYVNQALSNRYIEIWGNGTRKQNYVHVIDVVGYIDAIIKNFDAYNKLTFLGVSKKEYSNLELAKIISSITNAEIEFVNEDLSNSYKYNNKFTTDALGFEPQVSFKEGIINYIECQKKKY